MIEKKLEDARKDLLDLTYRNRLINYRPAPKRSVLVVDEEPRELFDILVLQGKRMQFSPRPKKTDDGDSESQSDQDSEEDILENDSPMIWTLPDQDAKTPNKHTDLYLQTNLESEFLQKRLFYIAQESKSVFEEQGYTILYLATGFLEWTETPKGVVHKAPLILIPVEIERDKIRTSFKLAWTGEDLITNISLQAKLSEIGVSLPSFEMPEKKDGIDLYFKTVTDSIQDHENWQVTREIHLDFFTYSKFVMYRDLDPVAWPGENSPALHPLITSIFGDGSLSGVRSSKPFPEQEIDARLPTRSVYHVRDADSSQIAVIEDLKSGMNLVVEGPPGTGKSQTIVNVIAEFLAIGKTVLFVSEKMAALEVVKGRLDSLGLGNFCLELHNSKKANKKKVLGEIQRAIGLRCPVQKDNDEVLQNVEDLRNVLNRYTTALSAPVGRLGFTPYDLYGMLESARRNFVANGYHVPNVTLPPPDSITPDLWFLAITTLKEFDTLLPLVSPVKENPWRFCTPGSFFGNDVEEIMRLLSSALENLSLIQTSIDQLVDCAGIISPTTQIELINAVPATEILIASEPIDRSVLLNESWNRPNNEAEGLIQKIEMYQASRASLASSMQESVFAADLDSYILEFEKSSEKILHSFIEPNNTTRVQNQMPNGALPPLDSNTLARWSPAIRTLEELDALLPSVSPVKENPWRFCTPISLSVHDVEEVNRLLSSALENLSLIQISIDQLVECAGIAPPTTRTELVNAVHATEMLTASEPINRSVLLNESWDRANNEAEGLIQKVELFQAIQASLASSMEESVFAADLDSCILEFEKSSEKILHSFIEPNNTTRVQNQMPNGTLPPLDSNTPARWSSAIRTLEELDALLPSVSPVKENPWRFCTPSSLSVHDVEEVNRLLSSALENLNLIQTSIDQLVDCAGIASPTTQTELVNTVHATEILIASEPIDRSVLLNESWDRANNEAEGLIQKVELFQAIQASLASSMEESVFAADLDSCILEFENLSEKILHSFIEPNNTTRVRNQMPNGALPPLDSNTPARWSPTIRTLEELDALLPSVSPVKENPWRFCTPSSLSVHDVEEVNRLLSSALENLSLIQTSIDQLVECAGIASPTTQTELVNTVHATEMLIASEPIDRSVLLNESWDRANNEAEGLIQKIEAYLAFRTSLASSMKESVFAADLNALILEFETSSKKILHSFVEPYKKIWVTDQRSDATVPSSDTITLATWSSAIRKLEELDTILPFVSPVKENPWRFCTPSSFFANDVTEIGRLLSYALENLSLIRTSTKQLIACTGITSPTTQTELVNAVHATEMLIASEPIDQSVLLDESWDRANNEAEGLIQKIEMYQTMWTSLASRMQTSIFIVNLDSLIPEFETSSKKILRSFRSPYNRIRDQIDGFYLIQEQRSDEALLKDLRDVQRCHSLKQEIHDASRFGQLTFGVHWHEEESCLEDLRAISEWIVKFRHELLTNVLTPRSANIVSRGVASDHARDLSATIKETRARFNSHMATLFGRLVADTTKYFPCGLEDTPFDDLQIVLQAWLTGIDSLLPWTQYMTVRKEVGEIGLESVKAADLDSLILDLHSLFIPYKKIRDQIDGYYITREPRSDEALITGLREVQRCHVLKQEIHDASSLGQLMFGVHWCGEKSNPEYLHAFSRWIVSFRHALLTNVLTPRSAEIVSRGVDSDRVREFTTIIEDARVGFNSNVAELSDRLAADSSKYFPRNPEFTHFSDIQAILQAWLTGIDRLVPWTRYLTLRKEIAEVISGYYENGRWMIQYPTVRKEVEETGQESDYVADLDLLLLDLHSLFVPYKKIRDQIDGYYLSREPRSDKALITGLREVQRCHVLKQEIHDASSLGQLMFGVHWCGEQSSPEHLHAFSRWIVSFRHALLTNVLTPRSVEIVSQGVDSNRLHEITSMIEEAHAGFDSHVTELLGRLAVDSQKYFPRSLESTHFTDIEAVLQAWLTGIDRLMPWAQYMTVRKEVEETMKAFRAAVASSIQKSNYATDLDTLILDLHSLLGPYKKIRAQIDGYYLTCEQRSDFTLLAGLREVQHCQALNQQIHEASSLGQLMFGAHWRGEESSPQDLHAFSEWIVSFRHALLTNALTLRSAEIVSDGVDSDHIREITTTIEEARARFNVQVPELLGRLAADTTKYFPCGHEATRFDEIATILEPWLLDIGRLVPWTQYLRVRKEVEETIAAPLMPLVEQGQLQGGELQACLKGNYAMSLLRLTFAHNSALDRFVGHVHEQRIKDFVDCDRKMIQENQVRIAQRLCKNRPVLVGGASPSSEIGFLQTELNRKRGHASIRQLLTKAMKPIQQIKPCFMMSPPSIAQFLDPSLIKFDIVIFDEASQVKPAEALGAILRGKQVAVIGDSKQLPPTSFFDKIVAASENEDGDDAMPSDMESVLNLCKTRFPSRTLLWHYRSRHDSLIGLSNKEFYNNELYVFPSPMRDGEELGLKFVYLPETVYDRGKSGMNRGEARAVAEAVFEHARRYPNRSLGVGTFNIHQQEAILEEIERLRGENPNLEEFFTDKGTETFFVKNLETIQGDERDVIFLSLGFGYDSQHKLLMNFGALNKEGGERRLNVLITRARRRCVVFANFRARELPIADIQAASRGVQVLKLFLEYAETGKVPCTLEPPATSDSPFEEAVYAFLTEYGYLVHKRIGCIGFQIDLAVVNPDILGEYLIGIECDGATYYSSRVARDRDRLRLEILEGLGWRIHRVWSTDWFRDPGACQHALIAAIDQALETAHERIVLPEPVPTYERSVTEGMFQAEIESVDDPLATSLPLDKEMPLAPAYVICDTLLIRKGIEPKDYLPGEMATLIAQVVNIEGPVHYDEVVRRIRDAFDVKRTGNQIRAAIDAGSERAVVLGTVMSNGEFFWPVKRPASIIRRRGEMVKPRIEMICNEELEEAVWFVLKWQYATEREALATEVCHVVGIRKVSGDARKRVHQIIAGMISQGLIEEKPNGLIDFTIGWEKVQPTPFSSRWDRMKID